MTSLGISTDAPFEHRCRLRVLLSVYSCSPHQGSEPGVGWNWALALARRGHEVHAVTRSRNREAIEAALGNMPEADRLRFFYHDSLGSRQRKASGLAANIAYAHWQASLLAKVREEHARHQFDVVHHLTFGSWRQPSRLWRLGTPFVFGPVGGGEEAPFALTTGFGAKSRIEELARAVWNRASLINPELRRLVHDAATIVTKTAETGAWVRRMGGSPTVALELGIDQSRIVNDVRTRGCGPLRCLFVGRLIDWKGVRLAVDAVAEAASGGNVHLTVAGDGKLAGALREDLARRRLHSKVRLVDAMPQEELFSLYQQHDLLLFPSLHDSSGNVVLEAFAHGLPVLCLKLGGPGEIVSELNGVSINVRGKNRRGVVSALSAALRRLEMDEAWRMALAAGALETARHMTWDAAVARVYESLEQVLPQRRRETSK